MKWLDRWMRGVVRDVARETAAEHRPPAPRTAVPVPPPPLPADDAAQNLLLHPGIRALIEGGLDCDELPGAPGELGRSCANPIPVNGVVGTVLYLSSLRTVGGQPLLFHRLGSRGQTDAYQVVTLDGETWDILFVDMYHPRKSRRAPSGLTIEPAPVSFLTGTTLHVRHFPNDLATAIPECGLDLFGHPYCSPIVDDALRARRRWSPPKDHVRALRAVEASLSARMTRSR